jgi:hypothetical protein
VEATNTGATFCGAIKIVTVRVAFGSTPLAAVIENVYEPGVLGEPESTPPADSERPGGRRAVSTGANVITFGTPTAKNVWV